MLIVLESKHPGKVVGPYDLKVSYGGREWTLDSKIGLVPRLGLGEWVRKAAAVWVYTGGTGEPLTGSKASLFALDSGGHMLRTGVCLGRRM